MRAIQDHATPELCSRLQTSAMGLGLVRLLLDAGRAGEARRTLASLQTGLPSGPKAIRPTGKRRTRNFRYASAC